MVRVPDDMKKEIGERLRMARKAKGLTAAEAAKAAGISQSAYSDMENAKKAPTIRTLAALVKVFNVPADWILTGEWPEGRDIKKVLAGSTHYGGIQLTSEEREQIDQYIQFLIRQRRLDQDNPKEEKKGC